MAIKLLFNEAAREARRQGAEWLAVGAFWVLAGVVYSMPTYDGAPPPPLPMSGVSPPMSANIVGGGFLALAAYVLPLLAAAFVAAAYHSRYPSTASWVVEWHMFALAISASLALTSLLTVWLKKYSGRPRPDFADRLQQAKANPSVMAEARQSYPSGHASIAFSGLSCLAMYLRNKLCIFFADTADTRRATPRLLLLALAVFLPLVVAATIAASRTRDHHHNFSDINAGAAIGLGVAAAIYHLFLPSSPAPPRSGAAACAAQSGNDQEAYGQSSPLL